MCVYMCSLIILMHVGNCLLPEIMRRRKYKIAIRQKLQVELHKMSY